MLPVCPGTSDLSDRSYHALLRVPQALQERKTAPLPAQPASLQSSSYCFPPFLRTPREASRQPPKRRRQISVLFYHHALPNASFFYSLYTLSVYAIVTKKHCRFLTKRTISRHIHNIAQNMHRIQEIYSRPVQRRCKKESHTKWCDFAGRG